MGALPPAAVRAASRRSPEGSGVLLPGGQIDAKVGSGLPTLERRRMGVAFDRHALLDALDALGRAAVSAGGRIEIAVYGGSALMLASNFRFASEDVDVTVLDTPWPGWLRDAAAEIGDAHGWTAEWFNDAVAFHLSPLADRAADHVEFGTFPREEGPVGLVVHVPSAPYMLALKLKAIRVVDPLKGGQEAGDILNLMRVVGLHTAEEAIALLARYFPSSGADAGKQRFLLKHLSSLGKAVDVPEYPRRGL